MLTIFAIPKPFRGHIGVIQRNAIRSWMLLRPSCHIILLGDDEGTAEVAREFGLQHIPFVARNEYGTPLVNSIFELAQAATKHRLLAYVNADIILFNDFISAVRRIPFRRFLMVGQRWDFDLNEPLDFGRPDWQSRLRECVHGRGVLAGGSAIDYFVFSSDLWGEIPPFAVGRTVWDNWLVYRARVQATKVVDTTQPVMAVHQNHNYSHISSGEETNWEAAWKGREAQRNLRLAGGEYIRYFSLTDATWILPVKGPVRPVLSPERLRRHRQRLPELSGSAWGFHLTHGLLSLGLALREKRLMKSLLRNAKQMWAQYFL